MVETHQGWRTGARKDYSSTKCNSGVGYRGQEPQELSRDAFCDKRLSPGGSGWAIRMLLTQLLPPHIVQSRSEEAGGGRDARIPLQPWSGKLAAHIGNRRQTLEYKIPAFHSLVPSVS